MLLPQALYPLALMAVITPLAFSRSLACCWSSRTSVPSARHIALMAMVLLPGLLGMSSLAASVEAVRAEARAEPLYITSPTLP